MVQPMLMGMPACLYLSDVQPICRLAYGPVDCAHPTEPWACHGPVIVSCHTGKVDAACPCTSAAWACLSWVALVNFRGVCDLCDLG